MDEIVTSAPRRSVLRPFGEWRRFRTSRHQVVARGCLSLAPLGLGTLILGDAVRDEGSGGQFVWAGMWIFIAWRFFRLGLYTGPWGVRVNNPVLTYWYPWRKVSGFVFVQGAESFLPKSEIIALATTGGTNRPIFAFSSTTAYFRLLPAERVQAAAELNRFVPVDPPA